MQNRSGAHPLVLTQDVLVVVKRRAAAHSHSFSLSNWKSEAASLPCFIVMQQTQWAGEGRERGSSQSDGIEAERVEEEDRE